MAVKSILNLDLLRIFDEDTRETYHGCNQKWYNSAWQRLSGCGPTVASNLIYYLNQTHSTCHSGQFTATKSYCLSLMEDIWKYVTPTFSGIANTELFYQTVLAYAKSNGLLIDAHFLDLPKNKTGRPELTRVVGFIEEAMTQNAPVAFLNLCNGAEKSLESWHWVTIIALEWFENGEQVWADIVDDGQIKKIDLSLWYNTTKKAGGFVYFTPLPRKTL